MTLEEENKNLKYQNEKLHSLVVKAWHIMGLVEELHIPDDVKAAIKTWQFLQDKAQKQSINDQRKNPC